ncbi:lipoprotein NlpI [Orbus hercynius]|uniref:Lipoprotein NlpI n=1 Tax=Orbus hercynius TaxID=593135 RepID=A0A495RI35_9GAMM|nr:lipoprotein NlpI [Orbus hercynius]RKS87193.1 lipoprotein NlpI [Orbus hercynius]
MKKSNLKTIWLLPVALFLSSYLFGCSSNTPVLAVPEQISYNDEVQLAQISQELYNRNLSDEAKMQLYYQRGALYDSLGFKAFAQNDFTQLLKFNVAIPDVYNYLGTYAMQEGDYNAAFLAFNTAAELDPDYEFVYINRAIALYNNDKYEPALADALKFYHYAPNEPIRILWVYLIESKLDKVSAKAHLLARYDDMQDKTVWGSDIVAFYLGKISENRLMINLQQGIETNKALAQRLCETYFYLGKYYQNKGDNKRAEMLFKYALASNVYNYLEHQQALFEIKQLNQQ